ncbi:putative fanconi anemia group E protein [Arabidopsis thaliana]|uniref:Uncharacterized protein n=2 Tax=Arabidopsis TaxID=3701 RepID=A0A178USJ3_ARATH|nr:Fanconi Anaemia group E protein C-terminal [Arabidopsis thaliana x Arabidopsis arenosa]OAO96583.1 hypothetical protein AXX17_AT4G33930 [Arabidopsis thaliana]
MEEWIPLFDIFLKSPSPEAEASLWLDQASNPSSSSSSAAAPINRSSFVSLLKKQCDQNSSPVTKKVLFIETLPNMVQSKILSFLLFEYQRFCVSDLVWLAREMLGSGGNKVVDFWVQRDAHNLLDRIPKPKFEWISNLDLDSADEDSMKQVFDSVPDWLSEKLGSAGTILPWLPVSCDDVDSEMLVVDSWNGKEITQIKEDMEEDQREVVHNIDHTMTVGLQAHDHEMAVNLRAQISNFESTSEVLTLCNDIRRLCLEKGKDSLRVLALIEPWNADDETAAVLLSSLHNGSEEEELGWPSHVLCSIVLPKFLSLEKSASRVLMSSTIEFCKIHQRAAEYALVFPLILRKEGINNFICEVISRVLKECLHLGQISGFCQKLLCGRTQERRFMFLPCHRDLISDELTWNEYLFILFQNILIHGIPLSQDSVDCLVSKVQELAERYSKSLKFGNFLLHFTAKCAPMLQAHKYQLIESVKCTNSLVTKSILSKLNAL